MAHARTTTLGSGGVAISKTHVLFAAVIGLGLVVASLVTKPARLGFGPGAFVAVAGYLACVVGLVLLKNKPTAAVS